MQPLVSQVFRDRFRLGLRAIGGKAVNAVLRDFKGNWNSGLRAWVWDAQYFLGSVLPHLRLRLPEFSTVELPQLILSAPVNEAFSVHLDVQVYVRAGGGHMVQCRPDPVLSRTFLTLGAQWQPGANVWCVGVGLDRLLAALQDRADVSRENVLVNPGEVDLAELHASQNATAGMNFGTSLAIFEQAATGETKRYLSSAISPLEILPVDSGLVAKACKDYSLYDYQGAGITHLLSATSALLADDMGLGKTRQAVVAAHLVGGRVLVLCPATLRINWQREITAVLGQDTQVAIVGASTRETCKGATWIIASYEQQGAAIALAIAFAVMVIDEAHYLKEHSANRTRTAFLLAQRVGRRMLLTGTPVLNREAELHALLKISGHPIGEIPMKEFCAAYAGSPDLRGRLSVVLKSWMLRRRKDVLKNLGTKSERKIIVDADLTDYNRIKGDQSMPVLAKAGKLRQTLEAAKLDAVFDVVTSLQPEDKIIIFCEYVATVSAIRAALDGVDIRSVQIIGDDTMTARQKAIDTFQLDPQYRVFVATTAAAGVGITLTAANYVCFAGLPWTPAAKRQAEDRAYRNGQVRDVIVLVLLVAETIDEDIYRLLESKSELEREVIDAKICVA